jgi:hypothetical protein
MTDPAHTCYKHEANQWFPTIAKQYNFTYDSTKTWTDYNAANLAKYQVVMFLDDRPDDATQRSTFQTYMQNGGSAR